MLDGSCLTQSLITLMIKLLKVGYMQVNYQLGISRFGGPNREISLKLQVDFMRRCKQQIK